MTRTLFAWTHAKEDVKIPSGVAQYGFPYEPPW